MGLFIKTTDIYFLKFRNVESPRYTQVWGLTKPLPHRLLTAITIEEASRELPGVSNIRAPILHKGSLLRPHHSPKTPFPVASPWAWGFNIRVLGDVDIQSRTLQIIENKSPWWTVKDNRAVSSKTMNRTFKQAQKILSVPDGGLTPTIRQEVCAELCKNWYILVKAAVRVLTNRKRCRDERRVQDATAVRGRLELCPAVA